MNRFSSFSVVLALFLLFCALGCRKSTQEQTAASSASVRVQTLPVPSNSGPLVPMAANSEATSPIPDGGLPFSGPSFKECHKGYYTEGEPRKDVTRLGYLCGPYHGLKALRPMASGRIEAEGGEVLHTVELKKTDCMRLFVVSDSSIKRIHAKIITPSGTTIAENDAIDGWGVIAPYGVVCGAEEGKYKISIRALRGKGEYAAQAWVLRNY